MTLPMKKTEGIVIRKKPFFNTLPRKFDIKQCPLCGGNMTADEASGGGTRVAAAFTPGSSLYSKPFWDNNLLPKTRILFFCDRCPYAEP